MIDSVEGFTEICIYHVNLVTVFKFIDDVSTKDRQVCESRPAGDKSVLFVDNDILCKGQKLIRHYIVKYFRHNVLYGNRAIVDNMGFVPGFVNGCNNTRFPFRGKNSS